MITIIAGGKKPTSWQLAAIEDYSRRLRKPYNLKWAFLPEDKFNRFLASHSFSSDDFVICCDERGENISSHEFSAKLETAFSRSLHVVVLIGGAYGFSESIRQRANLIWSFSHLVFPHALARIIVTEQIYRAQSIAQNRPYHHG